VVTQDYAALVERSLTGKAEVFREKLTPVHFVYDSLTWNDLGMTQVLQGKKVTSIHLSYGTVQCVMMLYYFQQRIPYLSQNTIIFSFFFSWS
jgi:hypothetical protein